jgi:hypothetical protein
MGRATPFGPQIPLRTKAPASTTTNSFGELRLRIQG